MGHKSRAASSRAGIAGQAGGFQSVAVLFCRPIQRHVGAERVKSRKLCKKTETPQISRKAENWCMVKEKEYEDTMWTDALRIKVTVYPIEHHLENVCE